MFFHILSVVQLIFYMTAFIFQVFICCYIIQIHNLSNYVSSNQLFKKIKLIYDTLIIIVVYCDRCDTVSIEFSQLSTGKWAEFGTVGRRSLGEVDGHFLSWEFAIQGSAITRVTCYPCRVKL